MKEKTIILGITGGIAAIKIPTLCKMLRDRGGQVIPIMTASAGHIISVKTVFQAAGQSVYTTLFPDDFDTEKVLTSKKVDHIEVASAADLVVVAPATAQIVAKMAHGLADDFLSTTLLAVRCPILLCPSMNVHMWEHPAVQANIDILQSRGVIVLHPDSGALACGYNGTGRLPKLEVIVAKIEQLLVRSNHLKGKKIFVTTGGTIEPIDDVRYLTNRSSGKMGVAIAEACTNQGANVTLIKAKKSVMPQFPMKTLDFETAEDLTALCQQAALSHNIWIHSSAVSDFKVSYSPGKISSQQALQLNLTPREKIYKTVLAKNPKLKLYLFKAVYQKTFLESVKIAQEVMKDSQIEGVIVNDIGQSNQGFEVDTNQVIIVLKDGRTHFFPLESKSSLAHKIVETLFP